MSNLPSYAEFRARAAQACRLARVDEPGAQSELSAVLSHVGERCERSGYEQFSLVFDADAGHGPQQGLYAATFDDGADWTLFLVPIAHNASGIVYEACLNRALPAAQNLSS